MILEGNEDHLCVLCFLLILCYLVNLRCFGQGLGAFAGSMGHWKREFSVCERETESVMTEPQVMEMCCRLICSLWKNYRI